MRDLRTKRAAIALLLPAAAVALGALAVPAAAFAAPPAPAAPAAPSLVFEETFENNVGSAVTSLTDYVGASGATYTADPFWLDAAACNGLVVQHDGSVPFTGAGAACSNPPSQARLSELAQVLGDGSGTNHVVAAYTDANGPAGATLLSKSADSGIVLKKDHYYAASIDIAEVNCAIASAHSTIQFGLQLPSGEVVFAGAPSVACDTGHSVDVGGREVRTGTFRSSAFQADAAGAAELVVRNLQTSGGGNDFAYDNIRFYDVTPTLSKSFSQDTVEAGQPVTLNLTVTNTSELGAKSGWSFTDNLPAGIVVAPTPNIANDCGAEVNAEDGAVEVSGGKLAQGATSCTISVDVVIGEGGSYTNVIEGASGLIGAPTATVRALVPAFELTKSVSPSVVTKAGEHVTYTFVVANTGELPLHDIAIADPGPVGGTGTMSAIDCPEVEALDVDETLTCTADYVTAAGDITGSPLKNVASATALSPAGTELGASAAASIDTKVIPPVTETPQPTASPVPAKGALATTGGDVPVGLGVAAVALVALGLALTFLRRARA